MPRDFTSTVQSETQQPYGTEPIVIIKVEWPDSSVVYYADKDVEVGTLSCTGLISQFSPMTSAGKVGGGGDYSSANVSLFDQDGGIKTLINKYRLAGSAVTVYQYYEGTLEADLAVLLQGRMSQPTWDEGSRTFNFTTEVIFEGEEVGYSAEVDAFSGFNNDVAGTPWPLCFGTVLEVPAVRIQKYGVAAQLQRDFFSSNDKCYIENKVENGTFIFPMDTSLDVEIGGIICTGTFGLETVTLGSGFGALSWELPVFTVSDYNKAHHSSLGLAERDQYDADRDNAAVCWLDTDEDLTGLYCTINHGTHGWIVNYCERQQGNKCFFRRAWAGNGSEDLTLGSETTIYETAPIVRTSWSATYVAVANDYDIRRHSYTLDKRWELTEYREGDKVVRGKFKVNTGASAVYETPGQSDIYVPNMIPSSAIVDVWAWRNYGSERIYVPVPSSYYTKYLNYSVNGMTVTAIEFTKPLATRSKEGWEEDIFVSLRSSVAPNSVAIIQYIVDNYTDLSVDATTFAAVSLRVEDFWTCFALTNLPEAMGLIEQIAWQSRCALINESGTLKIRFLPDLPATDVTLTEGWVGAETLIIAATDLDDVQTVITAEWTKAYSDRDVDSRTLVYRNNETVYGAIEDKLDAFVYNMEYCVDAMLDFWGYRYSNMWRQLSLRTFMNALEGQPFDCFASAINTVSTNTIRGVVHKLSHDSASDFINVDIELASKVTDVDGSDQPDEDLDYWPGNPIPPVIKDPAAGRGETDYVPPIPEEPASSGGGGTGDGDDDDEEGGDEKDLFLVFEQVPSEVERAASFSVTIKIVRYDGTVYNTNIALVLQLQSSDGSDVLNTTTVSFNGGYYSTDSLQITGGSGIDSAQLIASSAKTAAKTSAIFDIVDAKIGTMAWTAPSDVVRDVSFSAALSGGPPSGTVSISLNSFNNQDYLADDSGNPITSVTLNGSGAYSASNWQIRGGQGSNVGMLEAEDTTLAYDPAYSLLFNITGQSMGRVESDSVAFAGVMRHQAEDLAMDIDSTVQIYGTFGMTLNYVDGNDDPMAYYGVGILKAKNTSDGSYISWKTGGPDSVNYTTHLEIKFISGVWTFDAVELDWADYWGTEIQFEAYVTLDDYTLAEFQVEPVPQAALVLKAPTNISRGVSFNLEMYCVDDDGLRNTTYAPDNMQIVLQDANGDAITPAWVSSSEWSDGIAIVPVTISGGTGSKVITVTIYDSDNELFGATYPSIDVTEYTRATTAWGTHEGSYSEEPAESDPGAPEYPYVDDADSAASVYWASCLAWARALHEVDTVALGGSGPNCNYSIYDRHDYVSMSSELATGVGYFDVTAGDKSEAVGGSMNLTYFAVDRRFDNTEPCDSLCRYFAQGGIIFNFAEDPYRFAYGYYVSAGYGDYDVAVRLSSLNAYHHSVRNQSDDNFIGVAYSFDYPIPPAMMSYIKRVGGTRIYCALYPSVSDKHYSTIYTGGDTGVFSCSPHGIEISCALNNIKVTY